MLQDSYFKVNSRFTNDKTRKNIIQNYLHEKIRSGNAWSYNKLQFSRCNNVAEILERLSDKVSTLMELFAESLV